MPHSNTTAANFPETNATRAAWSALPTLDTLSNFDVSDHDVSLATSDTDSFHALPSPALATEHLLADNDGYPQQNNDRVRSTSSSQIENAERYSYDVDRSSYDIDRSSIDEQSHHVSHASHYSSSYTNRASSPGSSQHGHGPNQRCSAEWLPYTLRKVFLLPMAATSLALSIALATLYWVSARNQGLRNDADSTGILAARRYLPTICAVFFTQALVMISDDIKRTVPFQRLSDHKLEEIHPRHTWVYTSMPWWRALRDGFMKSRNGGRIGWVLVFSSLATGISVLAVSALSSSLIATEPVAINNSKAFKRFAPNQDGSISLLPRRETYLHATSNFLFNASTSMWVQDSQVILPFGPENLTQYPDFLPNGEWRAESRAYQMKSSCTTMTLESLRLINRTYVFEWDSQTTLDSRANSSWITPRNYTLNYKLPSLNLRSDYGCLIQLHANSGRSIHRLVEDGGLLWTNLSASHVTWDQFTADLGTPPLLRYSDWSPISDGIEFEFTNECIGRNLILVTTPWIAESGGSSPKGFLDDFKARAELCTPTYYESKVSVTAQVSPDARQLVVGEIPTESHRSELSVHALDKDYMDTLAFKGNKINYVARAPVLRGHWTFEGLEESLSALYSFNTSLMLANSNITSQAARLHTRLFHELVLSSVAGAPTPNLEATQALSTITVRRIIVVIATALPLSVILFLLFIYLCYLSWAVAARRRPLNLSTDPATVIGTAVYLRDHLSSWRGKRSSTALEGQGVSPEQSSQGKLTSMNPREFAGR
jgi:hypothetical protein